MFFNFKYLENGTRQTVFIAGTVPSSGNSDMDNERYIL